MSALQPLWYRRHRGPAAPMPPTRTGKTPDTAYTHRKGFRHTATPAPDHTAWLPQPCSWNDVNAASMPYQLQAHRGLSGIVGHYIDLLAHAWYKEIARASS